MSEGLAYCRECENPINKSNSSGYCIHCRNHVAAEAGAPNQNEIAQECAKIRQGWTDREFRLRSGTGNNEVEIKVVKDPGLKEVAPGY